METRSGGTLARRREEKMAKNESFDVTTGVDMMEVENAVHQSQKEILQRYDFKGSNASLELRKADGIILLDAPDEMKLNAMWDILVGKFVRRRVPVKNCQREPAQKAGGDRLRQEVKLVSGLDIDLCRKIVKTIKEAKFKKSQVAIEGDQVRVSSPSRDELQEVIALLKEQDFGVELKFGNYRS
jgi:cyclic-di-GMP-binding protein